VTGACFSGSIIYAFGNTLSSSNLFSVHKYTTAGSSSGQYMNQLDFPGLQPAAYDIAYSSQGIWVARDESDSPILRYNTEGVLTGYVLGTEVPAAAGLTVDPDGYLWVSDPLNDKIYKVDTFTSIDDTYEGISTGRVLQSCANPFTSLAVITAQGFSTGAVVQVFDIRGRTVDRGTLQGGSFTVDGSSLPAGTYIVQVTDEDGSSTLRICRTTD